MKQRKKVANKNVTTQLRSATVNQKKTARNASLLEFLCFPVDNSSIIGFRILWGVTMAYECMRFMEDNFKKADLSYVKPEFYGKYYGFEWISPCEKEELHLLIQLMFLAAIGIILGFAYPFCCLFFALSWTYLILIDSVIYLNHFYLIAIMAFILVILPANRRFSIDCFFIKSSKTMPRYFLWFLRAEQIIVYFFAGVAKINEDWLRAEPVKHWLAFDQYQMQYLHRFIGESGVNIVCSELSAYLVAYFGLFFDLFIGFLLLLPRGIIWYLSFVFCILFHCLNKVLFNIGIFPHIMILSSTLFFEPNWLSKYFSTQIIPPKKFTVSNKLLHKIFLIIMVLFLCHQIIVPLRSHFYEGTVAWNEKGHRWSWRMKLRDKMCDEITIAVDPKTNRTYPIELKTFLVGKQYRKLISEPVEFTQLARYISNTISKKHNIGPLEIYAKVTCSLNYRPDQEFFNQYIDLASFDYWDYSNSSLIIPLQPLAEKHYKEYPWNWDWDFIQHLLQLKPIEIH